MCTFVPENKKKGTGQFLPHVNEGVSLALIYEVLEWRLKRVKEISSDFNFLNNLKNPSGRTFYTFSEATEIAKQRNIKILNEIQQILENDERN